MSAEAEPDQTRSADGAFFARLREHKVIQWAIAYLGAALALAHGAELVSHALHWPDAAWRTFVLALIVGFPIALTIAWYHGHKGLTKIGAGELSIVSVLLLIGAVFFTAALQPHATPSSDGAVSDTGLGASAARVEPRSATLIEPAGQQAEPRQQPLLPNSVAVLPLENLSPNSDNAYIAAGLHEEILNQLVKLKNLNVIARTSVLQYATNRPPIAEIARALNVESIMEGSVRYAGNRIRVTTQLVDAGTGSHLWSETYEREFEDVFAIESDIAMNVANALEAEFSVEEQRRIEEVPSVSAEAYATFLALLNMAGAGNQSPQMLALLDRVITDAPEFADAHGLRAWVYANLLINTTFGSARDTAETETLARASAERALALDPNSFQANSALAIIDLLHWRWPEAARTYEHAYRMAGRSAAYYPWFTSWSGRSAEAIEIARHDTRLDPFNAGAHWWLGIVLAYAEDYDAAVAAIDRAIEMAPAAAPFHSWLAFAEIGRGNPDAALRALELTEGLLGRENRAIIYLVDLVYSYGRIGRTADAMRVFAEIEAIAESQEIGAGGWAMAYLGIGDQERALEQLRLGAESARDKVLDQGFFSLMNLRMNVTNDPVLEQPEFAAVRAELTGD